MFEVRSATYSDYDAIAALHATSWKSTYRGILSDHFLDTEVQNELINMWHNRLRSPAANQVITLVVQNDKIIGFACLYLNDSANFGSLLDNLHVSTNHQKLGVGKLLMRKCATSILDTGNSKKMYLWVFNANQSAKQVYEIWGGINIETVTKKNVDGTEANVCRYIWEDVTFLT